MRELARQSTRQDAARSCFELDVRQTDRTVRVTLSGILDGQGVEKMVGMVAPRLASRGFRVIVDGSGLTHLDYRATASLVRWNRNLRAFHHQIFLSGWNDYLKAILLMEDWDSELSARPLGECYRIFSDNQRSQLP
jgi:hypothetical protein